MLENHFLTELSRIKNRKYCLIVLLPGQRFGYLSTVSDKDIHDYCI
jgi:hypothetical protein